MADRHDLVVVGMGAGGLAAAEFAAQLGLRVAVVERARPGGDSLWGASVPSKSLLAAGRAAHSMRHADRFGLPNATAEIDRAAVWQRIRNVQHEIAATENDPERYSAMGVDVVFGTARLTAPTTVVVDGFRALEARRILLCTGSVPHVPRLPGLERVGFLTTDQLFALREPPASLIVLGGGPAGVELAQGCARLGIEVHVVHRGLHLLAAEEPVLVAALEHRLRAEGVHLHLATEAVSVERREGLVQLACISGRTMPVLRAEALLVATGREPATTGLGLDALGIEVTSRGGRVRRPRPHGGAERLCRR